jgi:flagellar biogenesis protein FliO
MSLLARIHITIAVLALTISMTDIACGAEPKVVRASHEAAAKEVTEESVAAPVEGLGYSPQWPEAPNTGAMLMRLCIGTVVVLGLCVGTLWFGKPWLQRLQVGGAGNSAFSIEGSVALGTRGMLYLVRVGDTQLVAGTDATGLKSLIAIPASFKEVLDDQFPPVETAPISAVHSFETRAGKKSDSKE